MIVFVIVFSKWRRWFPKKLPASRCHVIRSPQPECQQAAALLVFPRLSTNWTATRRRWFSDGRRSPFKSQLSGGAEQTFSGGNMRSLGGLAAILAAASVFLYLLSAHLPPGPKPVKPGSVAGDEDEIPESR